jgi:hypothetical protein
MKVFTFPALLAAALFSVVAVIPFSPGAKSQPRVFALEARLSASVGGNVKIYYDIGSGYSEAHSAELPLAPPGTMQLYRFPLPPGNYHSLRLDPIERAGRATFDGPLRIVTERGHIVRTLALSELRSLHQIASRQEANGKLEIVSLENADDPQLVATFSSPINARITLRDFAADRAFSILGLFATLALLLFAIDRAPRARQAARDLRAWSQAHPSRTILLVAALAVVGSAYPVVFLGKSHVSPNFGATLAYEKYPSLPGYTSSEVSSSNGADVGAAMWQHVPYGLTRSCSVVRCRKANFRGGTATR